MKEKEMKVVECSRGPGAKDTSGKGGEYRARALSEKLTGRNNPVTES